MREIRLHSSEGGAAGVATGRPYPYRVVPGPGHNAVSPELWQRGQVEVQTTVETPRFVGGECCVYRLSAKAGDATWPAVEAQAHGRSSMTLPARGPLRLASGPLG